jgi:3-oxoacyl-[acyl-carrier protein] reductase
MTTYRDQVVLVTGGTEGIGHYLVQQMAREGAKVITNSRSPAGGDKVASLADESLAVSWTRADISLPEECRRLVDFVIQKYGKIDVLVNNAGNKPSTLQRSIASLDDADLTEAFATHVHGPFNLCTAVWPHMENRNYGRILNFCSGHIFGSTSDHGIIPFGIAKSALIGLTKNLALPGGKCGIFVNAIFPAALDTGWNRVDWSPPSAEEENTLEEICSKSSIWPFVKWICSSASKCNGEMFSVCSNVITHVSLADTENVHVSTVDEIAEFVRVARTKKTYAPKSIGNFFGNHLGEEKSRCLAALLAHLKA